MLSVFSFNRICSPLQKKKREREFFLVSGNHPTWNALFKRFSKPIHMNEAAFSRARGGLCPLGALRQPGRNRLWGQWGCRGYVQAATDRQSPRCSTWTPRSCWWMKRMMFLVKVSMSFWRNLLSDRLLSSDTVGSFETTWVRNWRTLTASDGMIPQEVQRKSWDKGVNGSFKCLFFFFWNWWKVQFRVKNSADIHFVPLLCSLV